MQSALDRRQQIMEVLSDRRHDTVDNLAAEFGVSRSLLDRLKHNKTVTTQTIDDLCRFLDCNVEDIITYKKQQ